MYEALSNELTGKLMSSLRPPRYGAARSYFLEASFLFREWGAYAKATMLEEMDTKVPVKPLYYYYYYYFLWNSYGLVCINLTKVLQFIVFYKRWMFSWFQMRGRFRSPAVEKPPALVESYSASSMDVSSIVQASQSLAQEIITHQLLATYASRSYIIPCFDFVAISTKMFRFLIFFPSRLMKLMMINAGAQRGCFLLTDDGTTFKLAAEAEIAEINETVILAFLPDIWSHFSMLTTFISGRQIEHFS